MALETQIIEVPLAQGQDEGTQVEVLPMGKLSALQNARFRRLGRLGKRNGYRSIPSANASGTPLGNGSGRLACLGPRFCAVDDRFYLYDDVADAWAYPALDGGALDGGRLPNRWPSFVPGRSFSPTSEQSPLGLYDVGTTTGGTLLQSVGALTYAQGLIWTSWCRWQRTPTVSGWTVLVTGIDPESGLEVFHQDIPLSGAPTDPQQPVLLSTGNGTVVLISDTFTAGAKTAISIMLLTTRSAGFDIGAPVSITCVTSAANYYQGSQSEILIAYGNNTLDTYLGRWSVTTRTFSVLRIHSTVGNGEPTLMSCYGVAGGNSWLGYDGTAGPVAVNCYDSALAVTLSNNTAWNAAFLSTPVGPITFCALPGVTPTEVLGVVATASGGMAVSSFVATGIGSSQYPVRNVQPISQPFAAGGSVYLWVRHAADSQLGVATLVRLPQRAEYSFLFRNAALPIEGTVDDEDIDPLTAAVSGPVYPTPIETPAGYLTLLTPTVDSVVATGPVTYLLRKPLVVSVRHRSEGVLHANSSVTEVSGKAFIAGAQPMFVDARGAVEAGFIQSPQQPVSVAILGGGGLTENSVYQYTAYFESTDANGLIERSAPATPVVMSLGVGFTRTRVQFNSIELSKKVVRLRVFRTLANGTQFFQLVTLDVTPCVHANGVFTIEDNVADGIVGSNAPLYTQLGSEFENSQFPACRFSMVGGGRLWVGGGFKSNVVQASKAFRPRLSVEMVDDDAFRVFLPGECTGMAYLDNVVLFTVEGIYLVTGDGPDVAGVGAFSPPTRLPFDVGCINWRSVRTTDIGVFFESARGLCLLPRGFAEPVPMDQVMDTLQGYPHLTSSAVFNVEQSAAGSSFAERTVQWTALQDVDGEPDEAGPGVVLVYDVARQAWSVDTFQADCAGAFLAARDSQRLIGAASTLVGPNGAASWHPFRLQNTGFADSALPIPMLVTTGDMRLWGTFGHGVVNRVGLLGVLRSACTISLTKTTDVGSRATSKGYTGAAPEQTVGTTTYLEVALGAPEQRDVTALRLSVRESSALEGMSIVGLVVEADVKPQGFRLLPEADRIT